MQRSRMTCTCGAAAVVMIAVGSTTVRGDAPNAPTTDASRPGADVAAATGSTPADSGTLPRRHAVPRSSGRNAETSAEPAESVGALRLWWPALVVLGLILAATAAARRWLPQLRRPAGGGTIRVLARHYLSSKQSLCLVKLGRGVVLVGVSPDRIDAVAQVRDPDEASEIIAASERSRTESFHASLHRWASAAPKPESPEDDAGSHGGVDGVSTGGGVAEVRDLLNRVRVLRRFAGVEAGRRSAESSGKRDEPAGWAA